MRRVFKSLVVVSVVVVLTAANVSAAPRERGKEKIPTISKILRAIRALGDGLVIPLP